jgi:hypothetical protein
MTALNNNYHELKKWGKSSAGPEQPVSSKLNALLLTGIYD